MNTETPTFCERWTVFPLSQANQYGWTSPITVRAFGVDRAAEEAARKLDLDPGEHQMIMVTDTNEARVVTAVVKRSVEVRL